MKKNFIYLFICSQILTLLCAGSQLLAQGFSSETQNRLQHVLDSFQNDTQHPFVGGIVAAIKVDGLASWQGASGFASRNIDGQNNLLPGGTPFTPDTLSRIYSITKTFTGALVLELAREGAFGLDDPILQYLPLLNAYNPSVNGAVTIRQLLAHESGFSDYTSEIQLQVAVAYAPYHIWTPYEMVSFVHQIAAPGSERKYSNTNYVLLGAIIEAATGKTIEQYFRERFFDKLNLSSMYLDGRESIGNRGHLASPHDNLSPFNPIFQFTGQPTFPDAYTKISRFPMDAIVSLAFTSGGIVSNVGDVAEWGNALYGGRATSQATLDTMLRSISPVPDQDGDKLGYGILASTKLSDTDYFIGHDGNAPGYRSIMFYQPDRKMTLVVLTNFHGASVYTIGKKLYEALPGFLCGNPDRKEAKISMCFNGQSICADRSGAQALIKTGAVLGSCGSAVSTFSKLNGQNSQNLQLKAFPNPSSGRVTLDFSVPQAGPITIRLYDMNGKLKRELYNAKTGKNFRNQIIIESAHLTPGTYICRLVSEAGVLQEKIVLMK